MPQPFFYVTSRHFEGTELVCGNWEVTGTVSLCELSVCLESEFLPLCTAPHSSELKQAPWPPSEPQLASGNQILTKHGAAPPKLLPLSLFFS